MLNKIILWIIFIGPWFSLFFIKREDIKRFMPAGLFATLLMLIYNVYAYNQNHWVLHDVLFPSLRPLFVSGLFGAFPIVTIWILHFTYGKFWIYLLTNIVLDFMFAVFPLDYLLQDVLGIYELVNITQWGRFIIFVIQSVIIYGYFKWQDRGKDPLSQ